MGFNRLLLLRLDWESKAFCVVKGIIEIIMVSTVKVAPERTEVKGKLLTDIQIHPGGLSH